ncbi:MAG: HlyD family efflux transporter periplasmic adaptor subunit [Emergencia sp.]
MKKIKKKPIVLFIAALAALYVIIYIVPTVTGALVSSYTAGYGELKISDDAQCWLVRNETVYTAAAGGNANRYIKGGTLVRKGTQIMETDGSGGESDGTYSEILDRLSGDALVSEDFRAQTGGIVSYYADGYEGKLTPETMEKGSFDYYSQITQEGVADLRRDSVSAGEPVFKIVDRTRWYMVCFLPQDSAERYEKGLSVTVEFEDDSLEAEVYSVKSMGDRVRVILVTENYYSKLGRTRSCSVSLVTYEERGLILENDSIVTEDGQKGVYVRTRSSNYVFVPVQIIKSDGKQSLVTDTSYLDEKGNVVSTVEIYDEILKNPK